MIRDRGRIKWTAMMLPEHVEQLREWQKEDEHQIRQQPDEQQMEDWNFKIQEASERDLQLTIHYWNGNNVLSTKGFIKKTDALNGLIHIRKKSGVAYRIPFVDIKSISDFE